MRIDRSNKTDFFRRLYQDARSKCSGDLNKWYRQYRGDTAVDGVGSVPMETPVVRNITYELIESQVSEYVPKPKIQAERATRKGRANARRIEGLCRNLRDKLPFERLNDRDERNTYIYGGSVFLVEWDNTLVEGNKRGGIKLTLIEPEQFTPQPNIYEIDEMDYCFVEYEATLSELCIRYDKSLEELVETAGRENGTDDTATVIICYYRDEEKRVCMYVFSGSVELQHLENYYGRKLKRCKNCGKEEGDCSCKKPRFHYENVEFESVTEDKILSDGGLISSKTPVIEKGRVVLERLINYSGEQLAEVLEGMQAVVDWAAEYNARAEIDGGALPTVDYTQAGWLTRLTLPQLQQLADACFSGNDGLSRYEEVLAHFEGEGYVPKQKPTQLPYYTPRRMPIVIRKNTSQAGNVFGQSDVEFIRVQQQEINKLETRIQQKLLRAGVLPYSSHDTDVVFDDQVFEQGIKLASPMELSLLGKLDLQPNVAQDMTQAERLYVQAKQVLGITDSYQGNFDSTTTSGVARQIAIEQSGGRLQSKRVMKNAAYADIDRIVFELMLAYADEPREVSYIDLDGKRVMEEFNRYDFLELDENGNWYYDTAYTFGVDSTADSELTRKALWEENRNNYQSGLYGEVGSNRALMLYWQCMDKLHYPLAAQVLDSVETAAEEVQSGVIQ